MSNTGISTSSNNTLPVVTADPAEIARIGDSIDLTDRAGISVYGDRAQQAVSDYSDRILREVRNRDLGEVGKLLTDIIVKSKKLDPASLKDEGFLSRMFSSFRAKLERFKEQFEDVAGQIDRIGLELDRHKDILRRDIALLDDLHEETKQSIVQLDAYVQAGKTFAERFRATELPRLKVPLMRLRPIPAAACWKRRSIRTASRLSTGWKSGSSTCSRRANSAFSNCRRSVSFRPVTKP